MWICVYNPRSTFSLVQAIQEQFLKIWSSFILKFLFLSRKFSSTFILRNKTELLRVQFVKQRAANWMEMFLQLSNYRNSTRCCGVVWPMKTRKQQQRLAKFSLLEKLYGVDKNKFTLPSFVSPRHISEEKEKKKKKSNLCKLMKIYLSAHENHLMFPAVNIYSKTKKWESENRKLRNTFCPKIHYNFAFSIPTRSAVLSCTHNRETFR